MISDIEIDLDIFDSDLPIDFAVITPEGVRRERYAPNSECIQQAKYDSGKYICRSGQVSDWSMPCHSFVDKPTLELLKDIPEEEVLKPNKRLKLGKISFCIPPGFEPGPVKTLSHDNDRDTQLEKWRRKHPVPQQVERVVRGILELGVDQFRQSALTLSLRNDLNAAQIKRVLLFLVIHHGALKQLESTHVSKPTGGRTPGDSYQILWGRSAFFPQRNQ